MRNALLISVLRMYGRSPNDNNNILYCHLQDTFKEYTMHWNTLGTQAEHKKCIRRAKKKNM